MSVRTEALGVKNIGEGERRYGPASGASKGLPHQKARHVVLGQNEWFLAIGTSQDLRYLSEDLPGLIDPIRIIA